MTESDKNVRDHHRLLIASELTQPVTQALPDDATDREAAIDRARRSMLLGQEECGRWSGSIRDGAATTAEFVVLMAFMGEEDSAVIGRAAEHIANCQLPRGGWSRLSHGAIHLSCSVKAYLALKIAGHDAGAEHMRLAREAIMAHGGADACDVLTRFHLALMGQIAYDRCPAVPPEIAILPAIAPFALCRFHGLARALLVPLSIVWATKSSRRLKRERGIAELMMRDPNDWPYLPAVAVAATGDSIRRRFVLGTVKLMGKLERHQLFPARRGALQVAERWIREHITDASGLAGDATATMWSVAAMKSREWDPTDPAMRAGLRFLQKLQASSPHEVLDGDDAWPRDGGKSGPFELQPGCSPVCDTSQVIHCLGQTGMTLRDASIQNGIDWLLGQENVYDGDWSRFARSEPGGWARHGRDRHFVDVDTAATVLAALREQFTASPPQVSMSEDSMVAMVRASSRDLARRQVAILDRMAAASRRARRWVLAMQNADGGWGQYDHDNSRAYLNHVPLSDSLTATDRSSPAVTGGVLAALGRWEMRCGRAAVDRAVEYVRRMQTAEGAWTGGPFPNRVFSTWRAVTGLRAVGIGSNDSSVKAAASWLLAQQQESGGWYEAIVDESRCDPVASKSVSATQTAWALLALVAAGLGEAPQVVHGMELLIRLQQLDGSWPEGKGVASYQGVATCGHHQYSAVCYPLMALVAGGSADG